MRFVPMTQAEFERYLETAVKSYAEAHLKSGDVEPDEALALAQADYESLLPKGVDSPGQHLFTLRVDAEPEAVGMLWFASRERRGKNSAYIYDFQVRPELRGKGYGTLALQELERMLAEMQIPRVSLYVMGWNTGARALYERMGYTIVGSGMTKVLGAPVASTMKA
jgi:ribosomal protein S18 acetylase RimI-like enzyme